MRDGAHCLRVGICEDQPLYREMLERLLRDVPGFCVRTAETVAEVRSQWPASEIDVALLDYALPDGTALDIGRELRRWNPDLGVVILSAVDRSLVLLDLDLDEADRWSFLSKNTMVSATTLIRAIEAAADGRCVIDPETVSARTPRAHGVLDELSGRQQQVLRLIAEGYTNQAIAGRLGIALNSVNNHVNSLYAALQLNASDRNPRVSAVRAFLEGTA